MVGGCLTGDTVRLRYGFRRAGLKKSVDHLPLPLPSTKHEGPPWSVLRGGGGGDAAASDAGHLDASNPSGSARYSKEVVRSSVCNQPSHLLVDVTARMAQAPHQLESKTFRTLPILYPNLDLFDDRCLHDTVALLDSTPGPKASSTLRLIPF